MRASVHFTDVHKEAWPARFGPTRRCTFSVNHTGAAEPIMSHRGWAAKARAIHRLFPHGFLGNIIEPREVPSEHLVYKSSSSVPWSRLEQRRSPARELSDRSSQMLKKAVAVYSFV